MKLTKKHVALIGICFCLGAVGFIILQSSQREETPILEEPPMLEFYDDEGHVGSFSDAFVFHDFDLGWNNKSVGLRNVGDKQVEIMLIVTALPKWWFITWDYDGRAINPQTNITVTISIYASYRIIGKPLMLGISISYRVVES